MYNIYQKHEPSEEWKELESWTQTNLGVEAIYWERESFFAIRMALRAIHVKEGDYLLLSALSHPLVYQAARSLGCQILFIDVNQNNAQLNLEVLEHFLSLATIVNEKDELIYRKDNACIRAIILDYPLAVYQGAETLVFTAQRYQLKVLEDLLGMIPGVGRQIRDLDIDDDAFKHIEAMISSMTPEERMRPELLNGSRRRRIAKGSGVEVRDVNQLIKQFREMKKMMKTMSKLMGKGRSVDMSSLMGGRM